MRLFPSRLWRICVLACAILSLIVQPATAAVMTTPLVAESGPARRAQGTSITSDITINTTWTESASPYTVTSDVAIQPTAVLTIDPGVQVIFAAGKGLTAIGDLVAIGTPVKGITFTGAQQTAGSWKGILIQGSSEQPSEGSTFDYVTVAYGGSRNALIAVQDGRVIVQRSVLRNSAGDGVYAGPSSGGSSVEFTQFQSILGFGLRTDADVGGVVHAANNWWGSATGPATATNLNNCNPTGTGSAIGDSVAFQPYLTSATQSFDDTAGSSSRTIQIAARNWIIPADGISHATIVITMRDGTGQPIQGKIPRLRSTRGDVTDGGLTDVLGKSIALVTSATAGDAKLTAYVDAEDPCDRVLSASATITFRTVNDTPEVVKESESPYFNDEISIDPEPITRGVRTTLSVNVSNPENQPVTVAATFGFAPSGIGLAFEPVGTATARLEPGESRTVSVLWTPILSGHYCIQVQFEVTPAGGAASPARAAAGIVRRSLGNRSGVLQRNLQVEPGPLGSSEEKRRIKQVQSRLGSAVGKAHAGISGATIGFAIPDFLFGKILDFNFDVWGRASAALGNDPPRQDYRTVSPPNKLTAPSLQAGSISARRAQGATELMAAALDLNAKLRAATTALDRYGGASNDESLDWAAQQAAAFVYYKKLSGAAMIVAADRIEAYLLILRDEGAGDLVVTASDVRAYQSRLGAAGFNTDELLAARTVEMTDDEIEQAKQDALAWVPEQIAGSWTADVTGSAVDLRSLGQFLVQTSLSSNARRGLATTSQLTRIYDTTSRISIGNPTSQTATVRLVPRRINLPQDWSVSVDPPTLLLAPGAQANATVTVRPGSASVEGSDPSVAIEGYIGTQLLSGVVVKVVVPRAQTFDGRFRTLIPLGPRAIGP